MSTRIEGRALSELSDAELRAEAERRRRARSKQGGRVDPIGRGKRPGEMDVALKRAFANLEIPTSASLDKVEDAYHRLIEKYDPEKRRGDKDKYEAALSLSRQLSRSYRTITRYFADTT